MYADVVLPNVGFGMEEGRLIAWLKAPGDTVRRGEAVAEVEGDKATVELEAVVDGVLHDIIVAADTVVPVGTVLARIRTGAEDAEPPPTPSAQPVKSSPASAKAVSISPVAQRMAQEHGVDLSSVSGSGPGGRITREDVEATIGRAGNGSAPDGKALAAPAVRKLARDRGIDLRVIRGTGQDGHVTRADVESYLAAASAPAAVTAPAVTAPAPAASAAPMPAALSDGERVEVPLSQMRQVIARKLTQSMQDAPHFYTQAQLDLTDALAALPKGVGINALILYLTVQALKDVPALNATYENGRLYQYEHVHLATAIALPTGLIAPVLHRADDYSLSGLAERTKDLVARTRDGHLRPDELGGGTFTVSNLGIVNQVERFTAILTPPQVGVLAVGAAKERPVVINHGLHVRTTAYATLSADHRIVDGLVAARFLEALDTRLQGFGK